MQEQGTRVADFFHGKSILLTGASGYLGAVLLEVLLRCCPQVKCIYILLREKKGVSPEDRKAEIFKKAIFSKTPLDALNKVHVVAGDAALPNLGINEEDLSKIAQEVSIVFHGAASVSFTKSLRFMITNNSLSVDYVVDLCKKIKNIEVLVYTSTAYSNSNRIGMGDIEEQVYRLPFPSDRFLKILSGSDADIHDLVSQCLPQWPNTYTFSKCLAENIILEKAGDIPTVIVRPSIVVNCWKGACPGYVQEGSGLVDLCLAVGKGFIRVVPIDPDTRIDIIPADVVANAHIVAAWKMATERPTSPLVVNCVSGDRAYVKFRNYGESLLNMTKQYPLPKSFQKPKVSYQNNAILYWLHSVYEHYAPAYAIDTILRITGKKPRLVPLYRFYDYAMSLTTYFVNNAWDFQINNFLSLTNVPPEDQKVFYTDIKGFDVQSMAEVLPKGAPFYQWENDRKDMKERKRVTARRTMLVSLIQWIVLACIFSLFYVIVQSVKRVVEF